ncbi:nascent polypeptide-associated complex subunit alpha, muscle-specific form [Triticum aestivum]|uniref:nascent polypeptide-associated complex subunit alpha, muscle-specific form n=1 Tax=Triticum aestivum TaxID=4565 RepID=UPI001D029699|nr:nascent polypeptide-associated complex subunit alpha, muscle-specific form-like [Triticum aestivum]
MISLHCLLMTVLPKLFLHEELHTGSVLGAITIGLYVVLWGTEDDGESESMVEENRPDPRVAHTGRLEGNPSRHRPPPLLPATPASPPPEGRPTKPRRTQGWRRRGRSSPIPLHPTPFPSTAPPDLSPGGSSGFHRRRERPPPAVSSPPAAGVVGLPPDAAPPAALVPSAPFGSGAQPVVVLPSPLAVAAGHALLAASTPPPTPATRPSAVAGFLVVALQHQICGFRWPCRPAPRALSLRPRAGRGAPQPLLVGRGAPACCCFFGPP